MESQGGHRTDIEKLIILLPHWLNHNNEHIRDLEKWIKKVEDASLIKVADELRKAIDCSKKANRHIAQANLSLTKKSCNNKNWKAHIAATCTKIYSSYQQSI